MYSLFVHFTLAKFPSKWLTSQQIKCAKWMSLIKNLVGEWHQLITGHLLNEKPLIPMSYKNTYWKGHNRAFPLMSCCPPTWPSDCADWPGYPRQSRAPCAHTIIMSLNHEWRSSWRNRYALQCKTMLAWMNIDFCCYRSSHVGGQHDVTWKRSIWTLSYTHIKSKNPRIVSFYSNSQLTDEAIDIPSSSVGGGLSSTKLWVKIAPSSSPRRSVYRLRSL